MNTAPTEKQKCQEGRMSSTNQTGTTGIAGNGATNGEITERQIQSKPKRQCLKWEARQ